jgi:hypothetical protein
MLQVGGGGAIGGGEFINNFQSKTSTLRAKARKAVVASYNSIVMMKVQKKKS